MANAYAIRGPEDTALIALDHAVQSIRTGAVLDIMLKSVATAFEMFLSDTNGILRPFMDAIASRCHRAGFPFKKSGLLFFGDDVPEYSWFMKGAYMVY